MIKKYQVFLVLTFGLLLTRLFYLTLVLGDDFQERAQENRIIKEKLVAPRGVIYDRRHQPLAENKPFYQQGNEEISREKYLQLKAGDSSAQLFYRRYYPLANGAVHLLGYLGQADEAEIKNEKNECQYYSGDWVGQSGVEKKYDCSLRGEDGFRLLEVNIDGEVSREVGRVKPQAGKDIVLSIDKAIQLKAAELLSGKKGAIIVAQPQTGRLLAIVSSPSFDPNIFTFERDEQKITHLLVDDNKPFLDRAISARFPPGSIFKIVSGLAALEEKKITAETKIEDIGVLQIGKYQYSNWYFTQYGKTEGSLNLVEAIKRSNDIFFYRLGGYLGEKGLVRWAKEFDLDKKSGIDLPAELAGFIPTAAWKKRMTGQPWFLGNSYHLAIGQGDLALTPLSVNVLTNVIANGGEICSPRVAKTINAFCHAINAKKEYIDLIKEGMRQACSKGGTAFPFFDFEIDGKKDQVACKTGTAEFDISQGKTHAWFSVFAPIESPEISVTVFLEAGGEGSRDAAPIAKEILQDFFTN